MHISLVTLGVRDLAASTAFYEAMGWRVSSDSVPDQVTFLVGGGVVIGLFGWDALALDAHLPTGSGEHFRGTSLAINLPDPATVDEVIAKAGELGAEIVKAPRSVFWGGYSGYFRDLDGHLWEVAHNPGWPLDEHGQVRLPV